MVQGRWLCRMVWKRGASTFFLFSTGGVMLKTRTIFVRVAAVLFGRSRTSGSRPVRFGTAPGYEKEHGLTQPIPAAKPRVLHSANPPFASLGGLVGYSSHCATSEQNYHSAGPSALPLGFGRAERPSNFYLSPPGGVARQARTIFVRVAAVLSSSCDHREQDNYGAGPSALPHGVEARSFHVLLPLSSSPAALYARRGRSLS